MKIITSLFCLFIIAALAFTACSLSGGDDDAFAPPETPLPPVNPLPPGSDDPLSGSMSAATAAEIFEYSETAQGVSIDKFIDAAALENYLDSGAKALMNTKFIIATIDGKAVVKIAAGAFDKEEGAASLPADLSIKLPETLREIGSGAFANLTNATSLVLLIPDAVFDLLADTDPLALFELSGSGMEL
ncbi:MAG: leucine-rich repeat domain-containing protein, partial [Spirochaetales bacterium]|nr:leucine-rich repeat domain-containing protein [Spirochaetales bacterium]